MSTLAHAASYSIPLKNRIPGYGGFCPTVNRNCGLTYGLATKRYYDINRKESLNTSVKDSYNNMAVTGQTPVVKSLVVAHSRPLSATAFNSNPWNKPLPYSLHLEGLRRDNVLNFEKSAQTHRTHYKDHSGLAQPVPGIGHQRLKSAPPPTIIKTSFKYGNTHPVATQQTPRLPPVATTTPAPDYYSRVKSASSDRYTVLIRKGSAKERSVRNAFFEKR